MSKADKVLRKAAAFEKIALYGDRKSFLQAIAQQGNPMIFPTPEMIRVLSPVAAKLESVPRLVSEQAKMDATGLNLLMTAKNVLSKMLQENTLTDDAQLKQSAQELLTQVVNIRAGAQSLYVVPELEESTKDTLKQLANEAANAYSVIMSDANVNRVMPRAKSEMPVATNTAPVDSSVVQKNKYPTIDRAKQQEVFDFVVEKGLMSPVGLKADGVLGPLTQKALDLYKQYK